MWDQRYLAEGFAYGKEPNDFIRENGHLLGDPVLCVAAGEGRNAVYIAELGRQVTTVDGSTVGVAKQRALAESRGVSLEACAADLADFDLGEARWGGITSIFAHLPPALRADLHARVVRALRPGGVLLLEGYRPEQLGRGTGGPPVLEMLYPPERVRAELEGLDLELASVEREIHEGRYHTGLSATLQIIGRKRRSL